jgi:hypothetical protein
MPRVTNNMLGSNYRTNSTCVFGSMAGLAPTKNVRPNVSALPGYKFARSAANGLNWETGTSLSATDEANGCGLNRGCDKGKLCVKYLGNAGATSMAHRTGQRHF